MPLVTMGTESEYLRLTAQLWPTDAPRQPLAASPDQLFLKAELHLHELTASHVVDATAALPGLVDFFADAGAHWQTWGDGKEWKSPEGDLSIRVRPYQESGAPQFRVPAYVRLTVVLRGLRGWHDDDWTVTTQLTVQPGSALYSIAEDLKSLAGAVR